MTRIPIFCRLMQPQDAANLLAFELENRAWFEQFIEPHAADFYVAEGVSAHVQQCLLRHQQGRMHPGLVFAADGSLLGRVNLRHIDVQGKEAELGYRIGQRFAGQGGATQAVAWMLEQAVQVWGLQTLRAFVSTENLASLRVLERHGFVPGPLHPASVEVAGRWLDCVEMQKNLALSV